MASLSQWTWVWANSRRCEGQEAWSAAVHGVPKSWTQLSDWTRTDSQTKLTREGISLLKNCSTSLIISEVQMKTTMKFHLTLVRIVIINMTKKSVGVDINKREHLYFIGTNEISALTMKTVWKFHRNIKNRTALWPCNPTFGYISRGNKVTIFKKNLPSHVHCSIICSNQDVEITHVSVDELIKKMWCSTYHFVYII